MREIGVIRVEVDNPSDQPVKVDVELGTDKQSFTVPPRRRAIGRLPLTAEYGCLLPLLVVILSGIVGALA